MGRNQNEEPLGDVINRLMKAYGLEEGYYEAAITTYWEKMMGPSISKRTRALKLKDGVLTITTDSAPLRHELSFAKDKIVEKVNQELETRLIKSVEIK